MSTHEPKPGVASPADLAQARAARMLQPSDGPSGDASIDAHLEPLRGAVGDFLAGRTEDGAQVTASATSLHEALSARLAEADA